MFYIFYPVNAWTMFVQIRNRIKSLPRPLSNVFSLCIYALLISLAPARVTLIEGLSINPQLKKVPTLDVKIKHSNNIHTTDFSYTFRIILSLSSRLDLSRELVKVMVGNFERSCTSCLYIVYLNIAYCINSIKLFEDFK